MKRAFGGILAVGMAVALAACVSLPSGAERFDVPTWEWGKDGGMDALVSGRLAFTDDGCTLFFSEEFPESTGPVMFPNAVGVRFSNGVRAVMEESSGKVYAIEGQEFSYGGGWTPQTESWTEQCGDYSPDDVALINDLPAFTMPVSDPEPYAGAIPTSIPTLEDRGWYDVPTFEWDPAEGGDGALLEGTITMTDDGCATIEQDGHVIGLIFPNAMGKIDEGYAGGRAIFSRFPESFGVMAEDGMEVSLGGGGGDSSGQWAQLCPNSPVDTLFLVQDDNPWS